MNNIHRSIMEKLQETKEHYTVRIPLAIESGSRGWGFASPDSDYDCRFIYVREKDWYLSILEPCDFIEYQADEIFDINGWDLKKVIQHIIKSNSVIFEWLSSDVIYLKDERITKKLDSLAKSFFNPIRASYHYLSIAKNKVREIKSGSDSKLKKYFYVLRPLANLRYIEQYKQIPFMEYDRNLEAISLPSSVLTHIKNLKERKKLVNEGFEVPIHLPLMEYFENEITYFEQELKTMKFTKNKDYREADQVFREIIEMVWNHE